MAVNLMMPVQEDRPKKSTIDTVAQAVNIAANILGTGMEVYNNPLKRDLLKSEASLKNEEVANSPWRKFTLQAGALDKLHSGGYRPVKEGEAPELPPPPGMGGGGYIYDPSSINDLSKGDMAIQQGINELKNSGEQYVLRSNKEGVPIPTRIKVSGMLPTDQPIDSVGKWKLAFGESGSAARGQQVVNVVAGQGQQASQFGETKYQDKFKELKARVNKIKDPLRESIDMANRAEKLIASGSQIGVNVAATILAKSVGKDAGALSEGDIARYIPRSGPGTINKIFNYLAGDQNVVLTPEERSAMNTAVAVAAREMRKELATNIVADISEYSAGEPEFFNSENVKAYLRELEHSVPGVKKARVIRELKIHASENPNDPANKEDLARITQMENSF